MTITHIRPISYLVTNCQLERNLVMNTDKNQDIVLKPIKAIRGKPHDLLRNKSLVAYVHFDDHIASVNYMCPGLNLYCRDKSDNSLSHRLMGFKFQANTSADQRTPARGYMKGKHRSPSTAYAGEVDFQLRDMAYAEVGMDIVRRGQEALKASRKHWKMTRDRGELLQLITGLQLVGVTIVIKNARKDLNLKNNEVTQ